MTTKKIANLVLTFGLLSFGVASCDIVDPWDPGNGGNGGGNGGGGCDTVVVDEQMVSGTGTLRLVTSTNGDAFFGIESADGKRYEPTNLYTDQFGDGQKIRFSGYLLKDWGSINNYGELIELTEIETLD